MYGENLSNRYRFWQETITQIRDVYQGSLWVELSLDSYVAQKDQDQLAKWQKIGEWLKRDGIEGVSLTTNSPFDQDWCYKYEGWQAPYVAALKKVIPLPVAVSGLLFDAKLCEYILETEQADLILADHVFEMDPCWLTEAKKELADR